MEESGPANTTPEDILTPNDSLEQPTQVQVTPVTTSAAPGVVTAPMAGSNGSATVTPPTPPTQPTEPVNEPRTGIFKNKLFQKIGITSAVMLLIIGLLVLSTFLYQKSRKQTLTQEQKVAQIKDQTVTLGNSSSPAAGQPSLRVGVSTLFVNGDISTQGLLRFSSGNTYGQINVGTLSTNQTYSLPNSSGTICLDSNNCGFATSAQLTASVTTIQAATSAGTDLPQDLRTTASPTFAGLKLNGTATQNGNTLCDSSNNCSALVQGGNSFGTTLTFGTKDANGINVITNNTSVATISNLGQATFKNATNSTTAFQIQNTSGASILTADTTNTKINLANVSASTLGAWTLNATSLPSQRGLGGSVVANGYVYYVGGAAGAATSTVYYAKLNTDGTVGAWNTSVNSLPSARYGAVTVAVNGYIYAIGGNDSTNTTQATSYYAKLNSDGTIGTWSTTTALPSARYQASGVTANGYIYAVGGSQALAAQTTVYYAQVNSDGTLGAWTTSGNSLPAPRYAASTFMANGYMYVAGGVSGGVSQTTTYFAQLNSNGTVGAWSTTSSLPAARSFAGGAASAGIAYVVGGFDGVNAQSTIYRATINGDGTLSAWTTAVSSLPGPRWQINTVTANGFMYSFGGYDNVTLYATVYYAQLAGASTGLSVTPTTSTFNSSLTVQNADGTALLNANVAANTLTVGTSTADTPTLLVLGIKSTSGDPTGTNGAIYYNSSTNRFRCYQNGAWTNCVGGTGAASGDVNNGGNTYGSGMILGTLDNFGLAFITNGTAVQAFTSTGQAAFKNVSNSTQAFSILNTTNGILFQADTTNSRVGINLGSGTNLLANQGLDVVGALRLDGSSAATLDTFTTPVGSSTSTKINIPLYDPGALSQVVAFGLPSTANTTAQALSLFDGRATTHQPTIGVFSPDETNVIGFNWNGSNTTAKVQTGDTSTTSSSALTVRSGAVSGGTGLASGAVILQSGNGSGTNTSSGNVTVDSGTATGSGTAGTINIGTTNTSGITIGRVGITTAVNGTLQGSVINATTGFQISGTATNGQYLRGNGTDFVASALQASDMTGTIAINNGGTNNTSAGYTTNGIFYYDGTKFVSTVAGVAGQCLTATAGAPAWAACGAGGGGSISQGGNAYGTAIVIGATDANGVNILASNTAVATFSATGQATFQNTADSALAFKIQNASGSSLFTVDSSNARIYIGNPVADGTGVLLVLDTKNTAGDPTGVNGAMYYNSSLGKFRCYENGAWTNCIYNIQTATKTADQTFSATSYADVSDLSFSVLANKVYKLQCSLVISVPAGTNGGNLSTNGPASPTQLTATFAKSIDQSSGDNYATSSSYDDGSAATTFKVNTVSTGSSRFIVSYNALLVNGASNGTWSLRSKAYDGSSSITIYANSSCNIQPL